MLTYLQKLRDERDSLSATSSGILETAAKEDRAASETEKASIERMATRCAEIDTELKTFSAQYEAQRAYAKLRESLATVDEDNTENRKAVAVRPDLAARGIQQRAPQSWGEIFVNSDAFKNYDGHGSTGRVEVPNIFTRAPIDSTSIGFDALRPPNVWQQPAPAVTTPLLDAVGRVTTNSLYVQWFVETNEYPLAAVVPEGTAKPEATLKVETASGTLQTYAHWKGVTRQALSDWPMIQGIIETQLRNGVLQKLEADIATILGADTTIQDVAPATDPLASIRVALAHVQMQGFPNARDVLLNPLDWAGLDLSVMQATVNGPNAGTAFWGLRPIASAAVPEGTFYVGDFGNAVTLFTLGQASAFMSDSHADFFIKNILLVLVEQLALPLITQPLAVVRVAEPETASGTPGAAPVG